MGSQELNFYQLYPFFDIYINIRQVSNIGFSIIRRRWASYVEQKEYPKDRLMGG